MVGIVLLIPIWSDSLTLDCCSGIDEVLDTLATPLVVTPLDIFVLVVMEKVLLEGSEELTDMACMLVVEDWWLSDISELGFDVGAVLVTPSLFTVLRKIHTYIWSEMHTQIICGLLEE